MILDEKIEIGNCRLALQIYFYKIHNKFYQRDEIYLPGGYKVLGNFIFKEEEIDFENLKEGDIIFAQNLIGKNGNILKKSRSDLKDYDEWLYHLHSAIYLGKKDGKHYIWHATSVEGGTAIWELDKFNYHYLPVSVKRVI